MGEGRTEAVRLAETRVEGVYELRLDPKEDGRGVFSESFVDGRLWSCGVSGHITKVNLATTRRKGTVRGMHWQAEPEGQTKVVLCVAGRAFDAALDVRERFRTAGNWHGTVLEPHLNALVVPRGVAHGWQALEDGATLMYVVLGGRYSPPHERGVRPDSCGVEWPMPNLADTSERDLSWPSLSDLLGG